MYRKWPCAAGAPARESYVEGQGFSRAIKSATMWALASVDCEPRGKARRILHLNAALKGPLFHRVPSGGIARAARVS